MSNNRKYLRLIFFTTYKIKISVNNFSWKIKTKADVILCGKKDTKIVQNLF